MNTKNEQIGIILAGIIIGIISSTLVALGNPVNMGFCVACFIRDTAGALGLHRAAPVQYIRPEVIGLILGSSIFALFNKEFDAKGGSAPVTRFILGFFVMIGALMFLGCPFRLILRLAGGDFNAILGLVGFVFGIVVGIYFLNRGYSLKRTYSLPKIEGAAISIFAVVLLVFAVAAPSFIFFTEAGGGPGAMAAPIFISLAAGLVVGLLAQKTRFCMIGGIRDFILFREKKLLFGFVAVFASALVMNIIIGKFSPGFEGQPIAHTDGVWNFLGMTLVGLGSTLLGGCPLRQLIMAGEGNSDSFITVIGLFVGAAFAHNFALASSPKGPTPNGMVAVVIGLVVALIIAYTNTKSEGKGA